MLILLILGVFSTIALTAAFFYKDHITSMIQKVKGSSPDLEVITGLLPEVTLKLEPSSASEWPNKAELDKDEAKLEQQNLTHQGYFSHRTNHQLVEISLWQYQKVVTVALYNTIPENEGRDSEPHYSSEVLVKLDNGSTLCISNSPSVKLLPRHPQHKLVTSGSSNIFELMKMLKLHTPEGRKIIPTSDSKTLFTTIYDDQGEWIWKEAQLISNAFEMACEEQDIYLSDDDIDTLISVGQKKLSKAYTHQILSRLERSSKISEDKWDKMRNKLVVVHEKMEAEDLSDILYRLVTNLSDEQEEMLEALSEAGELPNPIESFNEFIDSLKPGTKRIAQMQHPVASEIYLANS